MSIRELTLNGKHYTEKQLLEYCKKQVNQSNFEWERDLYLFILEWLNSAPTVQAKTSGSTGKPKQIKLSKKKMLNSARLTGEFFGFEKGQSALLCLSTNFIAGKMMVVRAFLWQLNLIVVEPNGHPLRELDQDIDFAAMIPLQVKNSLKEKDKLNRIKKLLIGSSAVDGDLEKNLQQIQAQCYSSYGMTETLSHVAIKTLNGKNRSETFMSLSETRFTQNSRGCLCIHSPALLDEDLITNDIVELVNEKQFVWLGRFDNVVNSGGIKLFPEQIERKIEHLLTEPFFLAGVPDDYLGQKLVLVVEGKEMDKHSKSELTKKINQHLDKYEQVRNIAFIPKFQRTPTGKIRRKATLLKLLPC